MLLKDWYLEKKFTINSRNMEGDTEGRRNRLKTKTKGQ